MFGGVTLVIMSSHKRNHQQNCNHTLQQLAVGLQPMNLHVPATPPVFTFTVTDYSAPDKPMEVPSNQVSITLLPLSGIKAPPICSGILIN